MSKVDIIKKHIGSDNFYDLNGTGMISKILAIMEDYAQEKKALQPSFEKEVVICDRCGREAHIYGTGLCVNCMDSDRES